MIGPAGTFAGPKAEAESKGRGLVAVVAANLPHGTTLYHRYERNADGTPARCRVTGKCQTWKRDGEKFKLPVKHGLRNCFYITEANGHAWCLTEVEAMEKTDD